MDNKQIIEKAVCRNNNGAVLRTINVLRKSYNKLKVVREAVNGCGISEGEFIDAVNYLDLADYITLRHIALKKPVVFADADYNELEAKLTAKGISLLAGVIADPLVEV